MKFLQSERFFNNAFFALVEYFIAGSNALTGNIPDFSGANDLIQVDLDYNKLRGNVPFSLLSLPNLKFLYLNNNTLTGEIPEDFGRSTSLIDLFLSNNELEGEIPNYAIPTISKCI